MILPAPRPQPSCDSQPASLSSPLCASRFCWGMAAAGPLSLRPASLAVRVQPISSGHISVNSLRAAQCEKPLRLSQGLRRQWSLALGHRTVVLAATLGTR
jgi:hypothetical protein